MASYAVSEETKAAFLRDGAVKLEGFLDDHWLGLCREKYQWALDHPGPSAYHYYGSTNYYNDLMSLGHDDCATESLAQFLPLATAGPFAEAALQLFGSGLSDRVWYFDRELFHKKPGELNKDGEIGRSTAPFHQDTSYFGVQGPDMVAFWMYLEDFDLPKENCLRIVKGSHRGPMYDQALFAGEDDTRGAHGDKGTYQLLPLPDCLAEEEAGTMEMVAFDLKRGDAVAFHPHALHGGGGAPAGQSIRTPERRTLVLRFFGEGLYNLQRPMRPGGGYGPADTLAEATNTLANILRVDNLAEGEPFWHAGGGDFFKQVRGPAAPRLETVPAGCGAPTAAKL